MLVIKTEAVLGGAERRLARTFSRITKHDVDILVLTPNNQEIVNKAFKSFVPQKYNSLICSTSLFFVIKKIIKTKYDWISYCNESGSFILIAFFSYISKAKILWIIACVDTANLIFKNFKEKILFYVYSTLADRIDCLYPSCTNNLTNVIRKRKISSTPLPFTDIRLFYPKQKQNIIVFAARLENLKGWELFLEAIKLCKEELKLRGYKVFMCGSGSKVTEVSNTILKYQLEDIVEIKGYIPMFEVLPFSKIFLSLQKTENYPSQSLLEAISCGCWCIATNVGSTERIVKHDFGELVKGTSNDVAEAIIRSINFTSSQFYVAINAARKFAENNFTIKPSINYYSDIFDDN